MKLNIYKYESSLIYFKDAYKELQSHSNFSLRNWCQSIGVEDPNIILDILKGKRPLKLKYLHFLTIGLSLNAQEVLYFKTLIIKERSSVDTQDYYVEILKRLRPQDAFIDSEGGIFSHWLNVVIYELSKIHPRSLSVQFIKEALLTDVPIGTIQDSLNLLVYHGYLNSESDGDYHLNQSERVPTTPNEVLIRSTHTYYAQVLAKASEAVRLDVTQREFQCFALGMKKEDLIKAKEIIRKARKEIGELSQDSADHVYQFNFNGFPLADVMIEGQILS